MHRLVGAPEMSLRSWAEAPAPLQAPRLSGPRSASSPHLLTPAYTMGGGSPQTAHSFLLAAPSSVAKPERLGRSYYGNQ